MCKKEEIWEVIKSETGERLWSNDFGVTPKIMEFEAVDYDVGAKLKLTMTANIINENEQNRSNENTNRDEQVAKG